MTAVTKNLDALPNTRGISSFFVFCLFASPLFGVSPEASTNSSFASSSTPQVKRDDPRKDFCAAYFELSSALSMVSDEEKGLELDNAERLKKAGNPDYEIKSWNYLNEAERKKASRGQLTNFQKS